MQHKGLSILIPIYNFSVLELVTELINQATLLGISYEIRCYDDCSSTLKETNSSLYSLNQVIYKELTTNHGRSKIRNLLALDANFETLLFLDCDAKVTHGNYLQQYLTYINKDCVVYGGRSYQLSPPKNISKRLHWKYGSTRETLPASIRSKCPYYAFMSNSFIVSKKHFLELKMDETLIGYGYEDTLFGLSLKEHGIEIIHIDNPLQHIGIEESHVFLKKTQESIKNLARLTSKNIDFNTKLYRYYKFLSKTGLIFLFSFMYSAFKKTIEKNLKKSGNPSLFFFDLYKLNLITIEHKKQLQ